MNAIVRIYMLIFKFYSKYGLLYINNYSKLTHITHAITNQLYTLLQTLSLNYINLSTIKNFPPKFYT